MMNIYWTENAEPKGTTLSRVIYGLRSEADGDLLLDAVTEADIACEYDSVLSFDALVTPYAQLERRMNVLMRVMDRTAKSVKPVAVQIANPMKRGGAVHIPVIFELSDGQTITIFFHNPDTTPSRIAPSDELISWKWLLNKKDVTIVVAPEKGKDLHVQEVARRLMALADKNSAAFARANTRRAERLALIEANDKEIAELDGELERMNNEIQAAEIELEDSKRALAEAREAAKKRAEEAAEAARKAQEEAERRAAEEKAAEEAAAQTATQPPAEEPAPEPTTDRPPNPLRNPRPMEAKRAWAKEEANKKLKSRNPELVHWSTASVKHWLKLWDYNAFYRNQNDGRGIIFGRLFETDRSEAKKASIESGFSAKVRIASPHHGAEMTMMHELGHALDLRLGFSKSPEFLRFKEKIKGQDIGYLVSRYAKTNDRELVAEAFAEYMLSDTPRSAATEIGRMLDEAYAKWTGEAK